MEKQTTVIERQNEKLNRKFSFDTKEKVSIFLGAYGSGKSEIAVNFALYLTDKEQNSDYSSVVLADLDIINPFYRSLDAKTILNASNIHVISPQFANTNVEAPALPSEIYSVFDREGVRAVLDIGGDDLGARVVASLKNKICAVSFVVYMVVNMNRPFTDSKENILIMLRGLEDAAGLKVDGLINNTNLLSLTVQEDLISANRILTEISDETGIQLCFCCGMNEDYPVEWYNIAPDGLPFLRLRHTINYF